jgi:hypothetical protein
MPTPSVADRNWIFPDPNGRKNRSYSKMLSESSLRRISSSGGSLLGGGALAAGGRVLAAGTMNCLRQVVQRSVRPAKCSVARCRVLQDGHSNSMVIVISAI